MTNRRPAGAASMVACSVAAGLAVAALGVAGQVDTTDADLERASVGRTVTIGPSSGGRPVQIPLEIYVARVIAGEGEPNAPVATQEALAIAIRTYAVVNKGRHASDGFDLCDSTHCQVPRNATAASRRASIATAGKVVTYGGSPAEVFYSASCGGHSESAEQVWPGINLPYLKSIADDVHAEDVPWTLERSLTDIQRALTGAGFAGVRLTDITVPARSESGRAARVGLPGLRPDSIAGDAFRMIIGASTLRSTAFTVERNGAVVKFTGRGYGHGVGMCVIGAGRRARRGETSEQILKAYYPGVELRDVAATAPRGKGVQPVASRTVALPPTIGVTPPGARSTAPAAVGPARATVPRPVTVVVPPEAPLVAQKLDERAVRAREAVAAALGIAPPPLVVEVYDTSERFRQATGRPWWVAFDQRASSIALGPTSLVDPATLDHALRAAIAENLMSAPFAGRPMWVRVGGARYVARALGDRSPASTQPLPVPPAAGSSRTRLVCPADAELTLAVSAAAQREAESRAEACFVRAFQMTGDWRSVN